MKKIVVGIALSLMAVAVMAKDIQKDPKCDNIGQFAHGIAQIKAAGYDMNALQSFVSEPKAATFPLQLVKQQIYDQNLEPGDAYNKFYGQCMAVGYEALFQYYTHEQQREQLLIDNTALVSKINELKSQVTALQGQLHELQTPTPPSRQKSQKVRYGQEAAVQSPQVKSYGAPIETPKR